MKKLNISKIGITVVPYAFFLLIIYFIWKSSTKFNLFNPVDDNNYDFDIYSNSLMSTTEIQIVINELVSSLTTLFGTDELRIYNAVKNLTFNDWIEVNRVFGKKKYNVTGGYISISFFQSPTYLFDDDMSLLSILRHEFSNNLDSDVYNIISNLYLDFNVVF